MNWSSMSLDWYVKEAEFLKRVVIAEIEIEQEKWAKVRCGYCMGTKKDSWGGASCHICHGVGEVQVRMPVTRCAFCKGTGRTRRCEAITCAVCHGTGVLTKLESSERCDACAGSGSGEYGTGDRVTCTKCGGRGFFTPE